MPLLLLNALMLALFGLFLNQNRIVAFICLATALLPMFIWLRNTLYDEMRRTLALGRAQVAMVFAGGALGLTTATLLRWLQTHTLHPCRLRTFASVSMSIGFTEELIFRGYFLGRLLESRGPAASIILSALFHAVYKTAVFIPSSTADQLVLLGGFTFTFGVLLGHWRIQTQSIWPSAAFHVVFDLWVYGDRTTPWWVW